MRKIDTSAVIDSLTEALEALEIGTVRRTSNGVSVMFPGDHALDIAVDSATVVRPGASKRLPTSRPLVVVADQIPADQRTELDQAGVGWLDRRGHLKFRDGPVLIDADVPPSGRAKAGLEAGPLNGPVAFSVALAALRAYPEPLPAVRALARRFGVSPSGVSSAATRLIDAGLLTRTREAAVPALFWTVADAWKPTWVELPVHPEPSDGFVAVGTSAALALGAPGAAKGSPLDLVVADESALRAFTRKVRAAKQTPVPNQPARITVAPSPELLLDPSDATVFGHRCATVPIVAASIAGDRSRGAEIVEAWELTDRAW